MASMKAKKGNPFERLIAYNLQLVGFKVERIDDNTKGIDLIAEFNGLKYAIECKFHKKFSWNELEKVFLKTETTVKEKLLGTKPIFIFKANQQPVLMMAKNYLGIMSVQKLTDWLVKDSIVPIPKGYKVWKDK